MKTIIFTFISFFMLFSCSNNDYSFTPQNITPILVAKGALHGNGAENISQQNIVITNQTQFNDLITSMNTVNNVSSSFTETNIDFNNFRVIAVFSNIKLNGGSTIDITNVVENSDNITVTIQNLLPEGDNPVMNQPFHIVKIQNTIKPIVFQ